MTPPDDANDENPVSNYPLNKIGSKSMSISSAFERKQEQTMERTRNYFNWKKQPHIKALFRERQKENKGTNQKETVLIERNKMPYTNAFLRRKNTTFSWKQTWQNLELFLFRKPIIYYNRSSFSAKKQGVKIMNYILFSCKN